MKFIASIVWLLVLVVLIAPVALWGVVLVSDDPLTSKVADIFLWPIACSTRGCITTQSWQDHHKTRVSFAEASESEKPTSADTLTTLIRQHLVENSLLKSPVNMADATRYRVEVLNVSNEGQTEAILGLSLEQYDREVVLPFLKQEALVQEKGFESADELFASLAQERSILVLPLVFRWDKEKGSIASSERYSGD